MLTRNHRLKTTMYERVRLVEIKSILNHIPPPGSRLKWNMLVLSMQQVYEEIFIKSAEDKVLQRFRCVVVQMGEQFKGDVVRRMERRGFSEEKKGDFHVFHNNKYADERGSGGYYCEIV